jgi:xylose isomerase
MRTTRQDKSTAHLSNSRQFFLHLVDKVRSVDKKLEQQFVDERDYEALEAYTLRHLMGVAEAPGAKRQAAPALSGKR